MTDQTVLTRPEDPAAKDGYIFVDWYINGSSYDDLGTELGSDVTVTAKWAEIVTNLSDIGTAPVIDGNYGYAVSNWQDLWIAEDTTIKNVIFLMGVSVHPSYSGSDISISFEDCIVYACDQNKLIEAGKTVYQRIDNSGDGLCIGIDTNDDNNSFNVDVKVSGCRLIGANAPESDRNGYKDWTSYDNGTKNKSRGHGVSIGNQAGHTKNLRNAVIENNTFEGLKGHAIQLYGIKDQASVSIKGNSFISWGINKETLAGEKEDYAVRGDADATSPGTVTFSSNTYAESVTVGGITKDLSEYKVNIDRWTGTVQ